MKIIKNIPEDMPLIRCDYLVADRDYVNLYDNLYNLNKSQLRNPLINIIKENLNIRYINNLPKIKTKKIHNYSNSKIYSSIKSHKFKEKVDLSKIIIGQEIYLLREYNTTKKDDKYMLYDAKCIRKIGNYVEFLTTTQERCSDDILMRYFRLKN